MNMNTSQPQISLSKKLKKLKKRENVEKERSKNGDSIVAPAPFPPLRSLAFGPLNPKIAPRSLILRSKINSSLFIRP